MTLALGVLGYRVVDDFRSVDSAANEAVFAAIENALAKGDTDFTTVVATGMIEGIVNHALYAGIWNEIRPMLGELSVSYADAWVAF